MAVFGKSTFTVDPSATTEAYALAPFGGADKCSCVWCRNFRLVREVAYPSEFQAFLTELGIDANKEGEVWSCGIQKPEHHSYGGWFHFVGELDSLRDTSDDVAFGDSVQASITRCYAPTILDIPHNRLVKIDFVTWNLPWLLDEVDPDEPD